MRRPYGLVLLASVFDRGGLEKLGFTGFVTFGDLRESWLDYVPKTGGVYAVLRESDHPPTYLASNPGGRFKGKDPTVAVSTLEAKWVESCSVVYLGKGDNLQRRLKQYARFGAGDPIGHWGGRYIWQLSDSAELLVAWKRCEEGQTAAELESEIVARFQGATRLSTVREHRRPDLAAAVAFSASDFGAGSPSGGNRPRTVFRLPGPARRSYQRLYSPFHSPFRRSAQGWPDFLKRETRRFQRVLRWS
jgi:hypothetical protein